MREKKRMAARATAKSVYRFGSRSANRIVSFLLDHRCTPLEIIKATRRGGWEKEERRFYEFDFGTFGYITTYQSHGFLMFVLFRKLRITNRRSPRTAAEIRVAQPRFLTAPEVWARVNGHQGTLQPEDLKHWRRSLEEAVGLTSDHVSPDRTYSSLARSFYSSVYSVNAWSLREMSAAFYSRRNVRISVVLVREIGPP